MLILGGSEAKGSKRKINEAARSTTGGKAGKGNRSWVQVMQYYNVKGEKVRRG